MKLTATVLTLAFISFSHGFEREAHRIRGHMAALFTPFHPDGSLDLGKIAFWLCVKRNLANFLGKIT